MTAPLTLLDTDTISALMRKVSHPGVVARTSQYLAVHQRLTVSIITRYEILRGLHSTVPGRKLKEAQQFFARTDVLPLTTAIVDRAAELYGDLSRSGAIVGDADILIAATALENGLVLATNNVKHFSRFPSLVIDNWLA